jgi:hypothetical protein
LREVPLARNLKWPVERDFIEIEQWFVDAQTAIAKEMASGAAAAASVTAPKAAELGGHVAVSTKEYDAFLCHASEDKDAVVRPFADLMGEHGLTPWLDKGEIQWGETLIDKIQHGLLKSRFCVVFLSSSFLSKKRCGARELSTALSLEMGGKLCVLPLLLGITHEQLEAEYPLVSAKLCREIRAYDPAKQVPPGELQGHVEELKRLIGISDRGGGSSFVPQGTGVL